MNAYDRFKYYDRNMTVFVLQYTVTEGNSKELIYFQENKKTPKRSCLFRSQLCSTEGVGFEPTVPLQTR